MCAALLQSKLHLQVGHAILIEHTLVFIKNFTLICKLLGLKYL